MEYAQFLVNEQKVLLQLMDFAGGDSQKSSIFFTPSTVSAYVLVFDLADRKSFDSLDVWKNEFLSSSECQRDSVRICIGNKSDLCGNRPHSRAIHPQEVDKWCSDNEFQYFEVSELETVAPFFI